MNIIIFISRMFFSPENEYIPALFKMDFLMLRKHALLSLMLLSSASLHAIPIESNSLSQSNARATNNSNTPINGNMNWDLLQKNQQLENQIRELRGKIEEQDHAIEQLTKELSSKYTDLDQRLELLNQRLDPDSQQEDTTEPASEEVQPTTPDVKPPEPATTSTAKTANNVAVLNATNTSDYQEKAAYTVALDAYKKGGAKMAIAPMNNFIKNNPNSVYAGNAHFWLAEFNLAIEPPNYSEATKNYETVAAKFPNSAKAPRALYQLYSIAKDVNHNTASANVYKSKLLSTYPQSEEAGYFKKA